MGVLKYLLEVEATIDRIQTKLEAAMATAQQFNDVMKQIDDETTRIGEKIEELLAKLQAGGMSETEEAAVLAQLQAQADRLKTIAADPTDPVPQP